MNAARFTERLVDAARAGCVLWTMFLIESCMMFDSVSPVLMNPLLVLSPFVTLGLSVAVVAKRADRRSNWAALAAAMAAIQGFLCLLWLVSWLRGCVLFQRIWHKTRLGLSNGLLARKWQRGLPQL